MDKNIADIRKDYALKALDEQDLLPNPINQFEKWLNEAIECDIKEATAMNVATIGEQGFPSSRIILLKGVSEKGFSFYTNYQSAKGKELASNPAVALNFFWPELERQVRIQGMTTKLSEAESTEYFQSRPKGSQIGAWTSPQSTVIANREVLEERQKKIAEKHKDDEVLPKPKQWGGYLVEPFLIEFWQGRPSRLHDRILYVKKGDNWEVNRLAP
ncbi:pyridoxamine 5'-phosphate oxidase [Fulvivirga sediminis]|uniref:Pyridoxine/pyridoxamine 5'-phosphate oxidase n=1 Tax=Fulvivirga sediminis TaxID=2803949 RepID=A0A937F412_9BACT|nr:pyridoxamine 5'-phosphate oxidase [Fulvivirga sediminis]MBL3655952.1 pyridoxamine 5'-phosphate oxidase [Fulvivirga sediminis]